MNRNQRKAKQQRANQHRKVAKTVEYKRKQTESQVKAHREYDQRCDEYTRSLEQRINDTRQALEGMAANTDSYWRSFFICFSVVFGGLIAFHLLVSAFFKAVSP